MPAWIKMRTTLSADGRVRTLARVLTRSRAEVIGHLYNLWCIADEQTTDGLLAHWTIEEVDEETTAGFAQAMIDIDWLKVVDGGLQIPRFEDHNGSSAKKRAVDASRQARKRKAVEAPSSPATEVKADDSKLSWYPVLTDLGLDMNQAIQLVRKVYEQYDELGAKQCLDAMISKSQEARTPKAYIRAIVKKMYGL